MHRRRQDSVRAAETRPFCWSEEGNHRVKIEDTLLEQADALHEHLLSARESRLRDLAWAMKDDPRIDQSITGSSAGQPAAGDGPASTPRRRG